ncbi:amidohydrolase family protein [Membranicola marinus]|uniref:Amidohydrolase family protein n=1 Tax=Membranihabitans marinus TaxID=1227546 RepID=A0A953HXS5_9BACT|nr:amidohydrolase family protein [Membranihabitans marinus]MBY5960160.1 amidohydrolase family protein [Membranihabitans marinus]
MVNHSKSTTGYVKVVWILVYFTFMHPLYNQEADIIFHNGSIITMEEDFVPVEALAVSNGQVLSFGTFKEMTKFISSATDLVDLHGRTVIPGIVDPHNHFFTDAAHILDSTYSMEDRQDLMLAQGITTIGDPNTESWTFPPIQDFERSGKMKIKTNVYVIRNHACNWDVNLNHNDYPAHQNKDALLRLAGVKIFCDGGSCGTRPATTFEYPGGGKGDLFLTDQQLETWIKEADQKGYQLVIHAQGDRAIAQAQKGLESVIKNKRNPLRHRIDHNAFLNSKILSQYNNIGIPVACFAWFPTCLSSESSILENTYGTENLPNLEDWRSLIDANPDIRIAWHSDGPLLEYRLPQVMYSYVTRKEVQATGNVCDPPTWLAEHKITIKEVLRMMTIDAAYILHRDEQVGSLKPGKSADLVVLSGNPLTLPSDKLIHLKVLMTMVDGQAVFCHSEFESECNQILTSKTQEIITDFQLGNPFPNPANAGDDWQMNLQLKNPVKLQYTVYDFYGKAVFHAPSKNYSTGTHILNIRSQQFFKNGLYFVKFQIGKSILFKKFMVI